MLKYSLSGLLALQLRHNTTARWQPSTTSPRYPLPGSPPAVTRGGALGRVEWEGSRSFLAPPREA